MPSTDVVDVPAEAASVAARFQRIERPISFAWALLVAAVAVAAVFTLPLLWGVLVAAAMILAVRVPLFRAGGTSQLVTAADPGSVRVDFESACPPPLALQWGVADAVRSTEDGAAYEFSYLFGARSMTMETAVRSPSGDGEADAEDFELVVTASGEPWATYAISVGERDGETTVEVAVESDRRFGLRNLAQWFVASRYRNAVLEAQGYTVAERDYSLSLR
ncbi:hypothetical protein OB920_10165 [Halobacteria archaeon HArc-gm2]|nr:hypothetical protein [Halobacteria archaeon HArc-gm2]